MPSWALYRSLRPNGVDIWAARTLPFTCVPSGSCNCPFCYSPVDRSTHARKPCRDSFATPCLAALGAEAEGDQARHGQGAGNRLKLLLGGGSCQPLVAANPPPLYHTSTRALAHLGVSCRRLVVHENPKKGVYASVSNSEVARRPQAALHLRFPCRCAISPWTTETFSLC